jgi:hypothetical protein
MGTRHGWEWAPRGVYKHASQQYTLTWRNPLFTCVVRLKNIEPTGLICIFILGYTGVSTMLIGFDLRMILFDTDIWYMVGYYIITLLHNRVSHLHLA